MPELTEEQKLYIKEHPVESPSAMARKFGCSKFTIYRHLHRLHGDSFMEEKKKMYDEVCSVVRQLYPNYSATEIERMTGLSVIQIRNVARRIGVKHTEETSERIKGEIVARLNLPEIKAKRRKMIRKAFVVGRFRANSGMTPTIRIRFGHNITNSQLCARRLLVRKYNYIYDKEYGDFHALFYDSDTKRLSEKRERHYMEKYHFKFLSETE